MSSLSVFWGYGKSSPSTLNWQTLEMQMKFAELRRETSRRKVQRSYFHNDAVAVSATCPQFRAVEFEFQLFSVRQSSFECGGCDAPCWGLAKSMPWQLRSIIKCIPGRWNRGLSLPCRGSVGWRCCGRVDVNLNAKSLLSQCEGCECQSWAKCAKLAVSLIAR